MDNPAAQRTESLLPGIALMVTSMAMFAGADLLIKLASASYSRGQIIFCLSVGAAIIFATIAKAQGHRLWDRNLLHPAVMMRNGAEICSSALMISSLAFVPLTTVVAILQAMPLVVMAGAALFLGERVGWKRWLAAIIGFIGVLIIIRPGLDGFQLVSLLPLGAMTMLSIRDLATRRAPATLPTPVLAMSGVLSTLPLGVIWALMADGRLLPQSPDILLGLSMVVFGSAGYIILIFAVRIAPISQLAPFRYTRLLVATGLAIVVLDERPDLPLAIGVTLIVGSGLYAIWRERQLR